MNGYYDRPCIYSETDPCFINCKNKSCPNYTEYGEQDEEDLEED